MAAFCTLSPRDWGRDPSRPAGYAQPPGQRDTEVSDRFLPVTENCLSRVYIIGGILRSWQVGFRSPTLFQDGAIMKMQALDCPKCGASIVPDSKFCPYCGSGLVLSDDHLQSEPLGVICPHCRADNQATDKYCSKCGELLLRSCPRCFADVPVDLTHCNVCGAKFEAGREELRQRGVSRSFRGERGGFSRSFRGGGCGCSGGRPGSRGGRRRGRRR